MIPAMGSSSIGGSPPLARRARGRPPGVGSRVRPTSARAESTSRRTTTPTAAPAHLRSRGEHIWSWSRHSFPYGSPPLARRARVGSPVGRGHRRLTSARAESTRAVRTAWRTAAAHLRSRGEHRMGPVPCSLISGSPPLARRALQVLRRAVDGLRLTSARAESTRPEACRRRTEAAHLRSRGEHLLLRLVISTSAGSPPLARRARVGRLTSVTAGRLTSARAESTCRTPGGSGRRAAHLRSRGEHGALTPVASVMPGSPPLARRARDVLSDVFQVVRLTSARAESTTTERGRGPMPAAHLRSRGEHDSPVERMTLTGGSPPLARRAQGPRTMQTLNTRLTSARAESKTSAPPSPRSGTAHLRSRGEHSSDAANSAASVGLPPLSLRAARCSH